MAPEIKKGDLLLIAPNEGVESGDIAAVVNEKDEKEVTRITIRKDEIILTPDNPAYPTIVWEAKDKPKIIGGLRKSLEGDEGEKYPFFLRVHRTNRPYRLWTIEHI